MNVPAAGVDMTRRERRLKIVAAALVVEGERILLAQRRGGVHLGGYWEFPGGKLEDDESPEDCLRREIREELGIEISVGPMATVVFHRYAEFNLLLLLYWCRRVAGAPEALDCAAWRWVEVSEIEGYALPPADRVVVEMLREGIPRF
jgi:mutator protein MutT